MTKKKLNIFVQKKSILLNRVYDLNLNDLTYTITNTGKFKKKNWISRNGDLFFEFKKYLSKNEALRLNNQSYSVGVSKLRHLHVLILAPVILILTGIILQKS